MESLFISEFVPERVHINRELKYNENIINNVISNVEDYNKFINELVKSTSEQDKKLIKIKTIDRHRNDIVL